MPKFFFHLVDGEDRLLDPEGVQLAGPEAIRERALREARSMMAEDIMGRGVIDLSYQIAVEDQDGAVVYRLDFADAFRVEGERQAA